MECARRCSSTQVHLFVCASVNMRWKNMQMSVALITLAKRMRNGKRELMKKSTKTAIVFKFDATSLRPCWNVKQFYTLIIILAGQRDALWTEGYPFSYLTTICCLTRHNLYYFLSFFFPFPFSSSCFSIVYERRWLIYRFLCRYLMFYFYYASAYLFYIGPSFPRLRFLHFRY